MLQVLRDLLHNVILPKGRRDGVSREAETLALGQCQGESPMD